MQNLQKTLSEILKNDPTYFSDDKLLKNKLTEDAFKLEPKLIKYILSDNRLKKHFFLNIDGVLVFDKDKFIQFVNDKQFLPDSYTSFKNTIGLLDENGDYFKEKKDVVLAWPYKDCVLEGGQDTEDQKRDEIFYNEILAPDEIDRLFDAKVLTNFKRYDKDGEHANPKDISRNDNLIIKGNNLLALHSLKKMYRGKVKLIYIDPPFNTGNDEFRYNDKFNHSTWLTFMKNRLEIAKDYLKEDGVIYIHIDDKEYSHLKIICDEVFDRNNFLNVLVVKTSDPSGHKVVNPSPYSQTEYILMYAKNKSKYSYDNYYVPSDYDSGYNKYIDNIEENYKNWKVSSLPEIVAKSKGFSSVKLANDELGKLVFNSFVAEFALNNCEKVFQPTAISNKAAKEIVKVRNESKKQKNKILHLSRENWEDIYILNGRQMYFYSSKVKKINGQLTPAKLLTNLWSDIPYNGISNEGGVTLKNGKKPEKLLQRIIDITIKNNSDIVMDFFAGSGTSVAVAHKKCFQYIGIEQLDYGENDSITRLKNVIFGDKTGISKSVKWQGGGSFLYCELKKWNQNYIDEIETAKTTKDLLPIYERMKAEAFFRYDMNLSKFDEQEFEKLELDQQKEVLIKCLDKNHLYVNLSEMDDATFEIPDEDKEMNRKFYGL